MSPYRPGNADVPSAADGDVGAPRGFGRVPPCFEGPCSKFQFTFLHISLDSATLNSNNCNIFGLAASTQQRTFIKLELTSKQEAPMEIQKAPKEKYKQLLLVLIIAPFFFGFCGLGFWIDSVTRSFPLFGIIFSVISLIIFGYSGQHFEKQIIQNFRCPECGSRLPDYQLDKRQCVSYFCKNCNIKFETRYSIDHSNMD